MEPKAIQQTRTELTSESGRSSLEPATADVITAEDLGMVWQFSDNEDCKDCD